VKEREPRRRTYDTSLRDRQAEQTRESILAAAVDLIGEQGLQALTIAEVARRAGVSLRTVWRNFASTDELMDAVDRRAAQMGPTLLPAFEALDEHVADQYAFWEANASFILATLAWRFAQPESPPARAQRLHGFIDNFETLTPGLTPELRRVAAAALALLPNAMSWATLRKEFGWSAEEGAEAVGWILQLVVDELVRLSNGEPPRPRPRFPAPTGDAADQQRGEVADLAHDPS